LARWVKQVGPQVQSDRTKRSLTSSEQKANIVGDGKVRATANRCQDPWDSLAHKRFQEIPPGCVSGPSLCTQGAQTSRLLLWSGRGLCVDEDSGTSWEKSPGCQARVSAAWMHKQYGIALWAERFGQGQRGPAGFRLCNLVAQSRLKKVGSTAFSSPRSAGVEGSAFASSTGPEWWPLSQCAPAFSSCLRGLNRRYELILRGTRFNDSPFSMSRVLLVPGA